jgi:hypothetical protein
VREGPACLVPLLGVPAAPAGPEIREHVHHLPGHVGAADGRRYRRGGLRRRPVARPLAPKDVGQLRHVHELVREEGPAFASLRGVPPCGSLKM